VRASVEFLSERFTVVEFLIAQLTVATMLASLEVLAYDTVQLSKRREQSNPLFCIYLW